VSPWPTPATTVAAGIAWVVLPCAKYVLRPPIAQERVHRVDGGLVRLELRRPDPRVIGSSQPHSMVTVTTSLVSRFARAATRVLGRLHRSPAS
jgi:hypothetical protein